MGIALQDRPHRRTRERRSTRASIGLVIATLVTSISAVAPADAATVPVPSSPLTQDRQTMLVGFDEEYGYPTPATGFNGSVQGCVAGGVSGAFRADVIDRINWHRAMVGLQPVRENLAYTHKAQAAALMMAAGRSLSHYPAENWPCYSADGREAAERSNLSLGAIGAGAVDQYVHDLGANNASVGHRRWILHPPQVEVGTGNVPDGLGFDGEPYGATAMWVIGEFDESRTAPGGVTAWPPAGYFPQLLMPTRWSLTVRTVENLAGATVSVRRAGTPIAVRVIANDEQISGPTIVFEPDPDILRQTPASDVPYEVTVQTPQTAWTYTVTAVPTSDPAIRRHVRKSYGDFLGRVPADSEVEHWAQRLGGGLARGSYLQVLTTSDEWAGAIVDGFYRDTLGRAADPAGRRHWLDQLRAGVPVARVASGFYGSTEYVRNSGPTLGDWVDELYEALLGRPADPGGRAHWAARGQGSTIEVAYAFYQSVESRQRRVTTLYGSLLNRTPDAGGLQHWTARLADGDDLALARHLASSTEYLITP